MEAGILTETDHSGKQAVQWADGEPLAGWRRWMRGEAGGLRERFRVISYRCARCGLLESYATEPIV